MSHQPSPPATVASWSALAVAGLLAGLLARPVPPTPGPTTPSPTLPTTTSGPTPTAAPPTVPTPTATGTMPTVTTTPTPTSGMRVAPPTRRTPSRSPTPAPGVVIDDPPRGITAGWTSYLPTPEMGRKIFAAGLLGLTIAIAGLAALATRRRNP